ncbi:MAG: hypothetical protein C0467_28715 [Planctomycetaceae bacterium]|nr:hypothetical protein [Planctomycetaceae bacterium]
MQQHSQLPDLGFLDREPGTHVPEWVGWDTKAALALMSDTDATVERLGAHGADSVIARAADSVVVAHGRRDMASIRGACRLIEERANELTKQPRKD